MVAKMQMMKEMMDFMMNALKVWVSNDLDELVHRMDSPFTTPITLCPLPTKFRMLQIEAYDGSKNPLDHLKSFKTLTRCSRRDYMPSLPNYIERSC